MKFVGKSWYYRFFLALLGGIANAPATFAQKELPFFIHSFENTVTKQLLKEARELKYTHTDSALFLARKALQLSKINGNQREIVQSLITIAGCLFNAKAEYEQAKATLTTALQYANNLSVDDPVRPLLYNSLGNCYLVEGIFDSASYCYFKALSILEKQKVVDTHALTLNYYNAGANFATMGKHTEASYYLDKSFYLAQLRKDTEMLAYGYAYKGIVEANLTQPHDLDSAIKLWNQALLLFSSVKQNTNIFELYVNLGQAWVDKKNYTKAKSYYDSALSIQGSLPNRNTALVRGLGILAQATGNDDQAIQYFEQALTLSNKESLRPYKLGIYKFLVQLYTQKSDYKQALKFQQDYSQLSDSMLNDNMVASINRLEIKYRAGEKDKQLIANKLKLSQVENLVSESRARTVALVLGTLVLAISTIILYLKQRLQLHKSKVTEQLQRVEQLKAVFEGEERERTRIGRQLHDDIMVELSIVKMGLNTLPIRFPDMKQSQEYVNLVRQLNYTSSKLRQSAHNLMPDALLTEGIISALSYFCGNIRKMTGLKVLFQHYGAFPKLPGDIEISIYRIIQELMQNVIKHAQAKQVLLQVNCLGPIISITVEDDGIGFDPKALPQENKLGLKSMQSRLKALNGMMDIHGCHPHGTSVNISLTIPKSLNGNQTA